MNRSGAEEKGLLASRQNRLPDMPSGLKNKFVARVKRCSILAALVLYSLSMWWPTGRRKALDNLNA
jgi:hypothetical protein